MTSDLIARLEAAEGPDRALDAEIGWAVTEPRCNVDGVADWYAGDVLVREFGGEWPRYTRSLDAALPGENIVEMAWHEVVPGEALGEICEAWHFDRETGKKKLGAGKTEALARRIAALKAREAR